MNIAIRGIQETTLLDWEGQIASVIFLQGCNFKCPFCHNGHLISQKTLESIPHEAVFEYLESKKGWIDGVVISGGEPTLHDELPELIEQYRNLGMKIKLDTNGYLPNKLKILIDKNLIDYIAMDIKAPLDDRSREASGLAEFDASKIRESIKLLMEGNIDYEFRTTLCPAYVDEDGLEKIAKEIKGATKFVLQPFDPKNAMDKRVREIAPYYPERMLKMVELVQPYVEKTWLRGHQVNS